MAGALQVSTFSGASSTHEHPLKFGKMNAVVMPFTFICVEIFLTFFVKMNKLARINNTHSTTDHGANHRSKLVTEFQMLMLFIWWTPQEISKISTTCNALEDGIRIANDICVDESCICLGST